VLKINIADKKILSKLMNQPNFTGYGLLQYVISSYHIRVWRNCHLRITFCGSHIRLHFPLAISKGVAPALQSYPSVREDDLSGSLGL